MNQRTNKLINSCLNINGCSFMPIGESGPTERHVNIFIGSSDKKGADPAGPVPAAANVRVSTSLMVS